MQNQKNVDGLCVEVFSRISASVTHEIKNTLSIINENAGFLNDLAMMAGEDGGVPSQRVDDATKKVAQQVDRSNTIMKNFNRFSHSGDVPISQANLAELLQLMIDLTSRQAASASVAVELDCPEDANVTTYLLCLEALIFFILDTFYSRVDNGGLVRIDAKTEDTGVVIHFMGEIGGEKASLDLYETKESEQLLAKTLQGEVRVDENVVSIAFPSVVAS